ncbi:hypothetical protein FAZ95_12450 [Trinickia violacea]|uniref:Uncharacterized protein n=1 Tax=Trinickia violacea TaxID=2571746 RepID=A0A4P8ISE6_9BURK|nr:hypothetical protein [Trinickia violacea]QCP49914.1 hypothetical protein FAZ95_12450 [Trinickia violacea]
MSSLVIHELAPGPDLDRKAMASIRGGVANLGPGSPGGLGSPNINVNVGVSQNINQVQNIEVAALNNIGVLGADLGPIRFNVSPSQTASTGFGF